MAVYKETKKTEPIIIQMKFTEYFKYSRKKPGRSDILDDWIQSAIDKPVHTEIQSDGRIRKWAKIEEREKYLRVILLSDGQTVHNAFFDRGFKEIDQNEN